MRGSQHKSRVPPLPAPPGGRLVLRAHNALARSPLRWWCDTRPVLALVNPLMDMSAADVLTVCEAVAAAAPHWWIAGGWGVDALLDRQTRPHRDLDLVIGDDAAAVDAVQAVLADLGLRFLTERHTPHSFTPRRLCLADAAGHSVDLLPVDLHRIPFAAAEGEEAAFTSGRIAGREVPCLASSLHIRIRYTSYRWRSSDRHDLRVLRELGAAGEAPPASPAL